MAAGSLALLTACADDLDYRDGGDDKNITVTFALPGFESVNLGTRADVNDIDAAAVFNKMKVIMLDDAGNWTSVVDATPASQGNGTYKLTIPVPPNVSSLQFVANYPDDMDFSTKSRLVTTAKGVYWGKATVADLTGNTNTNVPLIANNARLSAQKAADVTNFTITGMGVYGIANKGVVIPDADKLNDESMTVTQPSVPEGDGFAYTDKIEVADYVAGNHLSIFEHPTTVSATGTNMARIIIRGKYNGATTDSYYVVAFQTRSGSEGTFDDLATPGQYTYEPIDILRNHHYKVNITAVRSAGWDNLEDAIKADPDNRINAWLEDATDNVDDFIANRDYALGVQSQVSVESSATTANFTVVTSYNPPAAGQRLKLTVSPVNAGDDVSWINSGGYTLPDPTTTTQTDAVSGKTITWYKYNIELPIDANVSPRDRSANIIFTSGDLKRTVVLTQKMKDYLHDDSRKITMTMSDAQSDITTTTEGDYFTWLRDVKGVKQECFHPRGNYGGELTYTRRDDGLIFPMLPAYQITYTIPNLSYDSAPSITGDDAGNFSLTTNSNGNYVVKMNNPTAIKSYTNANSASLVIPITVEGSTFELRYPLYRTGFLHYLDPANVNDLQPSAVTRSAVTRVGGWYYYEVVKAYNWTDASTGEGNFYMFDRNLGADSNYPYFPDDAVIGNYPGAVGGYFKISTWNYGTGEAKPSNPDENNNIIHKLGFSSNFKIASQKQCVGMQLKTDNVDFSYTNPTVWYADVENSMIGKVYIPTGGYYDADQLSSPDRAMLWTRTLVSGNQGFSQSSPEYGYWFMYLDLSGLQSFIPMRACDGAAGSTSDEYTPFKYMPIRIIWK